MAEVSLDSISNLSPELQKAFQVAVKAERRPIERIQERKTKIEEKVNLLDDIMRRVDGVRSLIPNLNSPIAIRELAFESTDAAVLSGTADKSLAEPGKHSLEVHQLASSASALSNRFPDSDETRIGSGYFTFSTKDGGTEDIYIDNENSTLTGIASIINQSGMDVKATVVRDQADPELPFRLILSSRNTGAQNEVEYPEFYFIDGESDFFIEEEKSAKNALIKYEGFEIESPTNEVSDLIRGVTLNLKGITQEGRPVSVSIEQDLPKTTVKMKDMVDNLNSVFSFIQEQNRLDKDSDTSRTLGGDYGIRMAEDRIKSALRENFLFSDSATVQGLFDLGVQFDKKGILQFDEKKFQHALQTNFDGVVTLLAGDGRSFGVMPKLNAALASINAGPSALLSSQKASYSGQIRKLNEDIADKEKRAEAKMASLKERLAKASASIAKLQGQANYFASQGSAPQAGIPIG